MKWTLRESFAALVIFLSLFLSAAAGAQHVSGRVYRTYAQHGTCCYAAGFVMKWCKADADGRPTNQCSSVTTNGTGDFGFNVGWGSGYYFPYLYRDDVYWGSADYPANGPAYFQAGSPNFVVGTLESRPRATPPQAVYPPHGAVNVPTTIVLQWSDGLDADRRRNDWPVTYDIYSSGNEYPEILVYSNVPCGGTPGSGICSMPVTGLVYTTRYQWRVVARMHSGPIVPQAGPDNSYLTSSATFRFSTQWDPAIPVYTISAPNGSLLRAAAGGGGTFDATGSSSTYETQFQFQDPNGGSLFSGDPIHIRTNRNHFVGAVNGGGSSVDAVQKWSMGWETWYIERIAGIGPVSPGDQVAFRSFNGNYMSAVNGGGSAVNAAATSAGPWETFTFR